MANIISYFRNNKHRLATVALIVGFIVDLITFRTIDFSLAQTILAIHLVIVGVSLLILYQPESEDSEDSLFSKVREWLPVLQQYSMGNLLSAFLVLYSASGSFSQSWPFFVLLALAVIGHETLKLRKYRLPFQTTLFFLNLLLFSVLATPIFLNDIGVITFLVSIAVAIFLFSLYIRIGRVTTRRAFKASGLAIRAGWMGMAAFIILLYFTNLIPPIPLSLKDVGAYYNVTRLSDTYTVEREVQNVFERFFDFSGTALKLAPGESAYVFTAVFAPTEFSENVVHRWQFFDEETGEWDTRNTVRFPIVGGRDGGYRGFSLTENPQPGRWRVSVETAGGQVIGRTYLSVRRAIESPEKELFTVE